MENKNWKQKLVAYSAMASALVQAVETQAQVVYTDIDPDINIFHDSKYIYIDFNNDGVDDVGLREEEISTFGSTYYNFELKLLNEHKVAAASDGPCTILSSSSEEICYFPAMKFPDVFSVGDTITLYRSWENLQDVNNAFSCGDYGSYGNCVLGFFNGYYGNKEQFFGFKILKTDIYLCWLRLYWADEYELLATGYACTANTEEGLVIDTSIVSEISLPASHEIIHLQFENNLIAIHSLSALTDAQVYIINLSGNILYSTVLNGFDFQIPFYSPPGVYVVQIRTSDGLINKKIIIR